MGCVEGKKVSVEEGALEIAEEGLGFYLIDAKHTDTVIRKYSNKGYVSDSHLLKISQNLHIEITSNEFHRRISNLYRKLKMEEGYYETKDLLCLGILLSKGRRSVKAELIFEIFDEENTGLIPLDTLIEGITLLISISLEYLACLVYNGQNEIANESKIMKYVNDLALVKDLAISRFTKKLTLRNFNVAMGDFISEMCEYYHNLVTPFGWRMYLQELFNAYPPRTVYKPSPGIKYKLSLIEDLT